MLIKEIDAKLSIDSPIISKIEGDGRKATKSQIEAFYKFNKVND
jgi:hypothetical protein